MLSLPQIVCHLPPPVHIVYSALLQNIVSFAAIKPPISLFWREVSISIPPLSIPPVHPDPASMSKEVKTVTAQTIEAQGASGGQTDGMIRENAVTGMSDKMCSSG